MSEIKRGEGEDVYGEKWKPDTYSYEEIRRQREAWKERAESAERALAEQAGQVAGLRAAAERISAALSVAGAEMDDQYKDFSWFEELFDAHVSLKSALATPGADVRERVLTGQDIHREWRDGMLAQGRQVAQERMAWETLSASDRDLDDRIAKRLNAIAGGEAGK